LSNLPGEKELRVRRHPIPQSWNISALPLSHMFFPLPEYLPVKGGFPVYVTFSFLLFSSKSSSTGFKEDLVLVSRCRIRMALFQYPFTHKSSSLLPDTTFPSYPLFSCLEGSRKPDFLEGSFFPPPFLILPLSAARIFSGAPPSQPFPSLFPPVKAYSDLAYRLSSPPFPPLPIHTNAAFLLLPSRSISSPTFLRFRAAPSHTKNPLPRTTAGL